MGAGASSAAPHDVALLVAIIDSLRTRQAEASATLIEDLRRVYLDALPAARAEALKPVLEAAVVKYLEARKADQDATHEAAKEASLAAAGFAFSTPKSDSNNVSPKSAVSRESPPNSPDSDLVAAKPPPIPNTPPRAQASPAAPAPANNCLEPPAESGNSSVAADVADTPTEASTAVSPTAAASPPSPSPQPSRKGGRNGSTMAERRRARQGKETVAEPLVPFLDASRSSFESAEIGGGTVYTTELTMYTNGTCELGSHDVGGQRRRMQRRGRGAGVSEALYWGGYEYWEGTWTKEATSSSSDNNAETSSASSKPSGGTYRVTFTSCRTQPSDPYCSNKLTRELEPGTGFLVDACVEVDLPPDVVENTAHPLGSRAAARAAAIAAIAAQRLTGESSESVSTDTAAGRSAGVQGEMASEAGTTAAEEGAGTTKLSAEATAAVAALDATGRSDSKKVVVGVAPVPCAVLRSVTGELRVRFTELRLESSDETKRAVKPGASKAT